jgi:uncharacterized protein YxjI
MRYVMRQKVLSLAASFTIKDENDRDAYHVKGESFRFGNKLSFQNTKGNELVHIDQRPLNWTPTYELWRDGGLLATVERALFSGLRHRFTIGVRGSSDLEAEGNFLDHEYIFTRADQTVAILRRRWLAFTATCGIEIDEGEDQALILASAVVVELVCHRRQTTITVT